MKQCAVAVNTWPTFKGHKGCVQASLHNISRSSDGTAQQHAEEHAKDLSVRKVISINETYIHTNYIHLNTTISF